MATFRAISTVCEAVVGLLRQSWESTLFNDTPLTFKVYNTNDFDSPDSITAGVSLYLYYVTNNSVQRSMPMRPGPDGILRRPELTLNLHFILTPWAREAPLAHEILGWMMRTIEDNPVIGAGLLNTTEDPVFEDAESIEIIRNDISLEELFRIWDVLPTEFHLSIPYTARVVRIQSILDAQNAVPVLTRDLRLGKKSE